MKTRLYLTTTATVFAAVALAHAARLIGQADVRIGSFAVPMAVSWVGAVVPALLSAWGFMAARRTRAEG